MTVKSSHVWHVNDLQAQAPVLKRRGGLHAVRTAKFVARKQWVVCGADDMYVRVFNYNTMDKVKQFEAHTDYIRCAARRGSNALCAGLLHHITHVVSLHTNTSSPVRAGLSKRRGMSCVRKCIIILRSSATPRLLLWGHARCRQGGRLGLLKQFL